MPRMSIALAIFGLSIAPTPAIAKCQLSTYVDIPVTMVGRRPIVTAQINGRDARFILDSGAFFSTIAKANAQEYGLASRSLGPNARLKGIGGDTSMGVATAKDFGIAGMALHHIDFAVGGSDTGFAGLLGQSLLGLTDVSYDLPHGVVSLMKGDGCKDASMAYWAGTKPVTIVALEPMGPRQRHTLGTITINGVKIRAVFDTGAQGSLLTLAAARRIGITPDSPGVTPAGFAYGLGTSRAPAWRTRFDTIDIGGEMIRKPVITFADQSFEDADMLIGIDFFLTHRVYVDNRDHRMFVTYEGGPLFGLTPRGAVDDKGAKLDLTDKAAEPTDAAGYSRRGAVLTSGGKLDAAIADFDKAVAMAPDDAHYLAQRAMAHLAHRQPLLATGDLDKAIAISPDASEARLARAQLRLRGDDRNGAAEDLRAADRVLPSSSDARLQLAGLYSASDDSGAALASYDLWLKAHPEDSGRAVAFNGRCWARALLGHELDKALDDCNAALRLRPGEPAYLDSRALVRLRRGELDKALADYDLSLKARPRQAWSLYARAIVERRLGKTSQADADRAAALTIDPGIAARAGRHGLEERAGA